MSWIVGYIFSCTALSVHAELSKALKEVVKEKNGGFGLNMQATVVDRDGGVKAVVFSGEDRGDQWPGYFGAKGFSKTHLIGVKK